MAGFLLIPGADEPGQQDLGAGRKTHKGIQQQAGDGAGGTNGSHGGGICHIAQYRHVHGAEQGLHQGAEDQRIAVAKDLRYDGTLGRVDILSRQQGVPPFLPYPYHPKTEKSTPKKGNLPLPITGEDFVFSSGMGSSLFLSDDQQKIPEGDVVRNTGRTNGTKENGVKLAEDLNAVLGHHSPGLLVVVAAPGEMGEFKPEAPVQSGGFLQDPDSLPDHFRTDAVTGNHSDFIDIHDMCTFSFVV